MNIRKIVTVLLMMALLLSISFAYTGCSSGGDVGDDNSDTSSSESGDGTDITTSVEYDDDDMDTSTSSSDMSSIILEGDSVSFSGSGITVNGSNVTITAAGMYSIEGTLTDGQIIVDTEDEETVKLVLQGVDITCSTSAPIYVVNAEKTVITLADGTENFITDGNSYVYGDASSDDPNAAIFSKDDLTINGGGLLKVSANYNHGIASKDDLKIMGGNIDITSVNDGIKGRDCVAIGDGNITIDSGGDGIQSNNDEDAEKGFVYIEGGTTINITADRDGIQAETSAVITGGTITISSGGGSNGVSSTNSTKGIKAETAVVITGGIINIDSADDSIHSNDSITIDGGEIVSASGDDGMHSDSTLVINGGDINITECYEGIESAVITINDGTIHLVSSDDGINASSGGGDSFRGGPGQGSSGTNKLYINGGYLAVDSLGDGLDINGSAYMTGGTVIINGPTRNDNGALDGTFEVNGGFLVAVGSSGMAESPSESSTQGIASFYFQSQQSSGTLIYLETEDGEEIVTFASSKTFQSVVVSSSKLEKGSTYVAYYGGSSTGTVIDGLYSGGIYTPGSEGYSFTL